MEWYQSMNFVCIWESGVWEAQIDLIDLDSCFGIDCFSAICGSLGWLGIMKAVPSSVLWKLLLAPVRISFLYHIPTCLSLRFAGLLRCRSSSFAWVGWDFCIGSQLWLHGWLVGMVNLMMGHGHFRIFFCHECCNI